MLAPLGHNNPPDPIDTAVAPYADAIDEAGNWLDGQAIETEAQMRAVEAVLRQIKDASAAVETARKSATAPLYDAWQAANARWKPTSDDLDRRKRGLVALIDPIKRRIAAEKDAEKRVAERAAWEATEVARKAAEAASATDMETQLAALDAQRAAEEAQVKAKAAATEKGLRSFTSYAVRDFIAFGRWLWTHRREAYQTMLQDYATRHKLGEADGVEKVTGRRAV